MLRTISVPNFVYTFFTALTSVATNYKIYSFRVAAILFNTTTQYFKMTFIFTTYNFRILY